MGKKSKENGPVGRKKTKEKNDNAEKAMGVGRRTTEERVNWNQMTTLRFQTRGRHQTSRAPFGGPFKVNSALKKSTN